MRRSVMTFEDLNRVLPAIDELEDLRLGIAGVAVPDPDKEWDDSRAYATIDKRVISPEQLSGILGEVENAVHLFNSSFFSTLRPLLAAYCEGDHGTAAQYLMTLGDQYARVGRHAQALRYFESALRVVEPLPERETQIQVLRHIARSARSIGDFDGSKLHYRRSAEIARNVEDLEGEVIGLTGCGNILAVQGRWAAAEDVYLQALRRLDAPGAGGALRLERGQLCINLGMVATRQDRFAEAEEWFRQAVEIREVTGSSADLALYYHNLAELRQRQGLPAEAHDIYEKTFDLSLPPSVAAPLAIAYAESLLRAGNLSEAVRWGREAEEQAIRARSPYYLVELYHVLGNIARERDDEGGFTFYEKAIQLAQEKGYSFLEGETLVDYACLRSRMGGQEEAIVYLHRAIELFSSLEGHLELARARRVLEELTAEPAL